MRPGLAMRGNHSAAHGLAHDKARRHCWQARIKKPRQLRRGYGLRVKAGGYSLPKLKANQSIKQPASVLLNAIKARPSFM
jgi:hypothetical protein